MVALVQNIQVDLWLVSHVVKAKQDQRDVVGLVDAKVIAQVLEPLVPIVATEINFELVERLVLLTLFFSIWIINFNSEDHFEAINALDLLSKFGIVVTHLKFGADNSELVFTSNFYGFEVDSLVSVSRRRNKLRWIVLGLQIHLCLAREISVLLEHVSELYGLYLVGSIFKWQHFNFILFC